MFTTDVAIGRERLGTLGLLLVSFVQSYAGNAQPYVPIKADLLCYEKLNLPECPNKFLLDSQETCRHFESICMIHTGLLLGLF